MSDGWENVSPADMAALDQVLAAARGELRRMVEVVVAALDDDPDPARAAAELCPVLLRRNQPNLIGGFATALVELAEAKRRGGWE